MFVNYFKIALRNILRHKSYSFINIAGLALGLTAVFLILALVQFETSYDTYHKNADRIYRVLQGRQGTDRMSPITPAPLAPGMIGEFPEVQSAARFYRAGKIHLTYSKNNFFENGFYFTDPEAFAIFSFELSRGDVWQAMENPFSVIISESKAAKYFGEENPIGKTISYNGEFDFVVTGVLKNLPQNSHLSIDFLAPFKTLEYIYDSQDHQSWGANSFLTYILLRNETDPEELEAKFPILIEKHLGKEAAGQVRAAFTPLTDIHLQSDQVKLIYLLSSVAIMILIMACINYMNLATARSVQRLKEIGIRKVVGAQRAQLIRQFLGESIFFTLLAFLVATFLIWIVAPSFNAFVERNLNFNLLENRQFFLWLAAIIIFVSFAAGAYPALAISSYNPITSLRNKLSGSKGSKLRKILVVSQFTISSILIIATLVIKDQLHFIRNKDMGFKKDQIIIVDIRDSELRNNLVTIQNELEQHSNIITVSQSFYLPNETGMATLIDWPGKPKDKKQEIYVNFIDYNYIDLYGIEIVEGRNFSPDFSDAAGAFLLNETAIKELELESPIGKNLKHYIKRRTSNIVGIVKDYHMLPLHQTIQPLCLDLDLGQVMADNFLSVKVTEQDIEETISFMRESLARFAPDYPFDYRFFDEVFDSAYKLERKTASIFTIFASLALFIASLGLFGLASFTTIQRTKEIGIRKVLGASTPGIVTTLSKQFTKWVLLANIIAWPIAYFAMNKWLQSFAYKINISLLLFIFSILIVLFIAFLSVGYQSIRAARTNPVNSLKYE